MQPESTPILFSLSDLTQTLLIHPGQNQHLGLPLLLSSQLPCSSTPPLLETRRWARASPSEGSITLPALFHFHPPCARPSQLAANPKTGRGQCEHDCASSPNSWLVLLLLPRVPCCQESWMCWLMVFQIKLWSKSLPPLQKRLFVSFLRRVSSEETLSSLP